MMIIFPLICFQIFAVFCKTSIVWLKVNLSCCVLLVVGWKIVLTNY